MYKNRDARAKLLFCLSNLLLFSWNPACLKPMLTFLNIAWKKMVEIGAVQFRCNYPGKGDWSSVRGGGLLIGCLPFTKSFRKIRLECKWHTTFRVVLVENFREQRNDWKGRPGALTICAENPVIPGRIQMERFIPVEYFWEKGDTFQGITFFPLLPNLPKFSVPFVWIIRATTFYKNFSQPAIPDL